MIFWLRTEGRLSVEQHAEMRRILANYLPEHRFLLSGEDIRSITPLGALTEGQARRVFGNFVERLQQREGVGSIVDDMVRHFLLVPRELEPLRVSVELGEAECEKLAAQIEAEDAHASE